MGIALLIKTLAVVGNRNSFEGDRDKLKTLTEAAQRESSKLAEVAEDDVTGAPERKRSEVPMNAVLAAEAALVLCAEARAIATGSVAVDIEVAVLLLTAAHRSVLIFRTKLTDRACLPVRRKRGFYANLLPSLQFFAVESIRFAQASRLLWVRRRNAARYTASREWTPTFSDERW
jgi:hypothetical protein